MRLLLVPTPRRIPRSCRINMWAPGGPSHCLLLPRVAVDHQSPVGRCDVLDCHVILKVEGAAGRVLVCIRWKSWEHGSCSEVLVVSDGADLETEKNLHARCRHHQKSSSVSLDNFAKMTKKWRVQWRTIWVTDPADHSATVESCVQDWARVNPDDGTVRDGFSRSPSQRHRSRPRLESPNANLDNSSNTTEDPPSSAFDLWMT